MTNLVSKTNDLEHVLLKIHSKLLRQLKKTVQLTTVSVYNQFKTIKDIIRCHCH